MGLLKWLVIGGAAVLLKKSADNAAEERARADAEIAEWERKWEQERKEAEAEHQKWLADIEHRRIVNSERRKTPCFFRDGLSKDEFVEMAEIAGKQIKRVKSVLVKNATVYCSVTSQSGLTDWDFSVDFNNWGHVTGTRWTWSENTDSDIPQIYGRILTTLIHEHYDNKEIHLPDYSDAVDENTSLGTDADFSCHVRKGSKEWFRIHNKTITCNVDWQELPGNHLYPVLSLLKADGFRNVKAIAIYDVDDSNSRNYIYRVEQVLINGNSFFQSGDEFPQKSDVVITYHAKKMVTIPVAPSYYKGKNYIAVGDDLQEMGFSEIYERPIRDLTTGWIIKDGAVEKVIVDENESFSKNSTYEYDVKIVIEYHTFKNK